MTCIVGLECDGEAYVGADQAAVGYHLLYPSRLPKVFKSGRYVIGYTSSFRMGQLLQYGVKNIQKKKRDPLEHLVTEFIPAVRKLLKSGGCSKINNNVEEGGFFIVGMAGKIYEVADDFQVNSSMEGMMTTGVGHELALGALYATEGQPPEERVLMALRAAAHFSNGVCEPFNVIKVGK